MYFSNAYNVDEIIGQKARFMHKIVFVKGRLDAYDIQTQFLSYMNYGFLITIGGDYGIIRGFFEGFGEDQRTLLPYFKAFSGCEIGLHIFVDTKRIFALKFGEAEFETSI